MSFLRKSFTSSLTAAVLHGAMVSLLIENFILPHETRKYQLVHFQRLFICLDRRRSIIALCNTNISKGPGSPWFCGNYESETNQYMIYLFSVYFWMYISLFFSVYSVFFFLLFFFSFYFLLYDKGYCTGTSK